MLDINLIREKPDLIKANMEKRSDDPGLIDEILTLDARRQKFCKK
jgi:seryl-tRNA synthetase